MYFKLSTAGRMTSDEECLVGLSTLRVTWYTHTYKTVLTDLVYTDTGWQRQRINGVSVYFNHLKLRHSPLEACLESLSFYPARCFRL